MKAIDLIEENKGNIIACKCNNEIKNLEYEVKEGDNIEFIDLTHKDGMLTYVRGVM